jgi:hypothetical protein
MRRSSESDLIVLVIGKKRVLDSVFLRTSLYSELEYMPR